jgi:hypothetical protein
MARPGDTIRRYLRIEDNAGAGVTGLTIAALTVTAGKWNDGSGSPASHSPSAALTEVGLGVYWLSYTLPNAAGSFYVQVLPVSASHHPHVRGWEDVVEANDIDSVGSLVARPVVTVGNSGTLGQVTPISIPSKRRAVLTFAILDQNGDPIDMTGGVTYTNFKVGFRSQTDMTATPPKLDAVHGTPTGFGIVTSDGLVVVTIPMACTIFNVLAEGASPETSETINYEITAEVVGTSPAERIAVVASSPLTITRREEGAT